MRHIFFYQNFRYPVVLAEFENNNDISKNILSNDVTQINN